MVERNHSEYNYEKINLSKVKLVGIPIGRILDESSRLGSDQETLEGLRKAKESYFPHHMVNKYTITLV